MPRSYRNIKMYEQEIIELKKQGLTKLEISEKLGFSKEQVKNFLNRHKAKYAISEMRRYFSVSKSGYYDFIKRMDIPAKNTHI